MEVQSKVQQLQDWSSNRGWRIEFISWAEEDERPMVKGIEIPMGILSLLGIMLFLGGFAYLIVKRESIENIAIPVAICVAGVILGAIGSILHEKVRKGEEWKDKYISDQATCTLLVNPKRPREVELLKLKT